jgi:hypothetical protein
VENLNKILLLIGMMINFTMIAKKENQTIKVAFLQFQLVVICLVDGMAYWIITIERLAIHRFGVMMKQIQMLLNWMK